MDFEVSRQDLATTRSVAVAPRALAEGEARIEVDVFGFSTNNITYAVFGDMLRYWEFFPAGAPEEGDDTAWGRVPVWGFGSVVEARSSEVAVGERLFGYYPMGSELIITPGRAGDRTVTDMSPHRATLPSAYNSFQRCSGDPIYAEDREELQMLLYPLFFTSFVIDDFLVDHDDFGSAQVIISSASAKTSIGEAFLAHERSMRVVGLTSPGNVAFTESLGVYDQVLTYDQVDAVDQVPSAYIDVSGNADVLRAVHTRLGSLLGHSMIVGGTHWDHEAAPADGDLPGPTPEFLFAPTQIAKRTQEWGPDGLSAKVAESWNRFTTWVPTWIELTQVSGVEPVEAVYRLMLSGVVDPKVGFICSLETKDLER
ncbi:MAG: DUF2855 family protein [Actinomycetes bacterium]